jgi:acid stress-induced BolA-like protein IbaG/YrbA
MDKLNKKAEKMVMHFNQIKNEFELKYPVIENFIKNEFGISPTSELFANWFFDERYFPTKNNYRLGVKITDKDILDFCSEYFIELKSKQYNITIDITEDINFKVSEIIKEFFSAFYHNKKFENDLIKDLTFILLEQELPLEIIKIKNNEIHFKAESIRFCFYNIYLLKKQKIVKDLLVTYLHEKFSLFDNLDFNKKDITQSTTHKKFSTKPTYYPK